jgi:callose synthase
VITKRLDTYPCRILEKAHTATTGDASSVREQRFGKINIGPTYKKYWADKVFLILAYFFYKCHVMISHINL